MDSKQTLRSFPLVCLVSQLNVYVLAFTQGIRYTFLIKNNRKNGKV